MGRGVKIAIAAVLALIVLLVLNALWVDGKTEKAEATVPTGRILDLTGGEMQVDEPRVRATLRRSSSSTVSAAR